ncbi:MAG: CRISPR-associated endonuclease Cas2, partial [bacterium]|nr:CRISPR-associated endonuclease Cas2 [bacterium]
WEIVYAVLMGKLEKETKARARRQNIKKIILGTLYGTGLVSLAILAPNAIGTLVKMTGTTTKNDGYRVRRSLSRLLSHGLIRLDKTERGTFVRITSKGKEEIERLYVSETAMKKPARWDGKWRIVVYDLKERRKTTRDRFRRALAAFGFMKLQDSVWAYPHDCEDLITLIKADFKIGKEVLYIIAESIEYDTPLKHAFKL